MSDDKVVVYEDERTGEIIPAGVSDDVQTYKAENALVVKVDVATVGTLELSPETEAALDEPLNPADVQIRPDGLVYLPWTWYAARLNKAFGRAKWGMVPQGSPKTMDTGNSNVLVTWGFWLVVKGIPLGFAYGETSYRSDNYTMSYTDAVEGAKSIALARNCKMLGMSLELWNKDWITSWQKQNAETYKNDRGKIVWRKKLAVMPGAAKTITPETSETPVVDAAVEEGGVVVDIQYAVKELRTLDVTKKLAKAANVKTSQAATFIGTLDESQTYTMVQLAKMLTEAQ